MDVTKRTVVGYAFKLAKENPRKVLEKFYDVSFSGVRRTLKACVEDIKASTQNEDIGKSAKPRILRIVVEELTHPERGEK